MTIPELRVSSDGVIRGQAHSVFGPVHWRPSVPDIMTDSDVHPNSESNGQGQQPLCPGCLAPYDPLQHYCEECGEAVGLFTPYIPFVNIRFNYSIFGRLWQTLCYDSSAGWGRRLLYFLLIVLIVPVMFLALPFVLIAKRRDRGKQADVG